jgi:hypothetical protein
MINGSLYDWESVNIMLPNGITVGITNIDYDDERPIEERYGKGSQPRGYGRKNYKASAKMEIDIDAAELLAVSLATSGGGGIYNAMPFPITVCYAPEGQPMIIDVLPLCKIVKTSSGAKQGDDNVGVRKYDLKVLAPIQWGAIPALVPTNLL